jgi:hypothetical protein
VTKGVGPRRVSQGLTGQAVSVDTVALGKLVHQCQFPGDPGLIGSQVLVRIEKGFANSLRGALSEDGWKPQGNQGLGFEPESHDKIP